METIGSVLYAVRQEYAPCFRDLSNRDTDRKRISFAWANGTGLEEFISIFLF